jgi:transcriptional regulator with XRE-family HTH domain
MERNMTQRELAWHLQVSVQAVSKWERGYTYPDISMLSPIARIFYVSLDELFGYDKIEDEKNSTV